MDSDPAAILDDPDFVNTLNGIADTQGRPREETARSAEQYLQEIAARPSRRMVSLASFLGRLLYRRAYEYLNYDRHELEALARLTSRHPVVYLPCHRSNLDRPVMHRLLWENRLGPNFTAGGLNMDFFPIGPIWRRAGVFFIRRTFTNNPVYKLVLQTYLAWIIEQRQALEWYVEGGRSRTGKLRTPRYGLLGYAADALASGKCEDIYLIPTSINYDHVLEIGAYTAEQQGILKEKETFGWLVKSIRSLRRGYGDIHVRFGEPVSMLSMIDPHRNGLERRQDLRQLASEVCIRINRITPVTPASLVAIALLAGPAEGMPRDDLEANLIELVDQVESRNLPTTEPLSFLRTRSGLDRVASGLENLGIISRRGTEESSEGEALYRIPTDQRLAASYYRNTVVHFFLSSAVAELGLAAIARDTNLKLSEYVLEVRELLDMEFFFADDRTLISEITSDLDRRCPEWNDLLSAGNQVVERIRPHRAPWVLRTFLEAYLVVADEMVTWAPDRPWNKRSFLAACMERATEYASRQRISAEACSNSLFSNALRLAGRRGLLEHGHDDLPQRRQAFASKLADYLELMDSLEGGKPHSIGARG